MTKPKKKRKFPTFIVFLIVYFTIAIYLIFFTTPANRWQYDGLIFVSFILLIGSVSAGLMLLQDAYHRKRGRRIGGGGGYRPSGRRSS